MSNLFTERVLNMAAVTPQPEDYTGEDGLLYCGKCHTPKEAYFPEKQAALFGRDRHPAECDCQKAQRLEREAAEQRRKHLDTVEDLKRQGFTNPTMQEWTFANDNGKCPQMEIAHFYVEHWEIRIKKQLTNNINHELKTPVAAIQGYLETLLANPSLDAQRRTDFLEKSAAQTERLRRLLADISTITRMDEASQLIQKERVVLNDLIAEVTADMELKPADQRLRVNIDFPQQVEIVGSPSLLASIFRNLADNAAAYSGGRDIFIRLLSDTPEECTVSFADNGIGIGGSRRAAALPAATLCWTWGSGWPCAAAGWWT